MVYINVGDGCWRPNVLVSSLRCWWPIQYIMKITIITKQVANIMILPPTSENSHHHKVTNITMSPTSLSPSSYWAESFLKISCEKIIELWPVNGSFETSWILNAFKSRVLTRITAETKNQSNSSINYTVYTIPYKIPGNNFRVWNSNCFISSLNLTFLSL